MTISLHEANAKLEKPNSFQEVASLRKKSNDFFSGLASTSQEHRDRRFPFDKTIKIQEGKKCNI